MSKAVVCESQYLKLNLLQHVTNETLLSDKLIINKFQNTTLIAFFSYFHSRSSVLFFLSRLLNRDINLNIISLSDADVIRQ